MVDWTRTSMLLAAACLLPPLAACGGGGSDNRGDGKPRERAVDGTFVGKLSGTSTFVAVVASPAVGKKDQRDVTVYLSDGKRLSEWFAGSVEQNRFSAASDDRDAEAKGKLSGKAVTGTVKLADGKTVRYNATRATGPAGLYDLKVSSKGELSGASSAGVGLKGEATLKQRGTGEIKLADGKRRKFDVIANAAGDGIRLKAGQLRLIILRGGELRGAGRPRPTGSSNFFVRSSS
jgi:hypothetical protein